MSIPLSNVLDALRDDLKAAQANSDPENPLIIQDIEVELQTVVTCELNADGSVKGKVDLKILDFFKLGEVEADLALKGGLERAATQKIRLKLSAASLNKTTGKLEKTKVSDTVKNEPQL